MIECQIFSLQLLKILLQRAIIAFIDFLGLAVDSLEYFLFVPYRERWQVLGFKSLGSVIIFIRVRVISSAIFLGFLDGSSLVLIDQRDVLIILYEAQPREELLHDSIFEVLHYSELFHL